MPVPERVLDTSVLVQFWRRRVSKRALVDVSLRDARRWAEELTGRVGKLIVTPVYIEFVAGASSRHELNLFREFLTDFQIIDDGRILREDWADAKRLAQRVPRDGKPRHLGDCLIAAIAARLRHEVSTLDRAFPKGG